MFVAKEAMHEWYRLGAAQGDPRAQYSLGRMYAEGQGVPQDDIWAVRWWRLAADQGDPEAQYNLGFRYAEGQGVPQDYSLAHMWFNLAAAQDNKMSALFRDGLEKEMTSEQIAKAKRLTNNWLGLHAMGELIR